MNKAANRSIKIGVNSLVIVLSSLFAVGLLAFMTVFAFDRIDRTKSENILGTSGVGMQYSFVDDFQTVEYSYDHQVKFPTQGSSFPILMVFIDYECPFSKTFYNESWRPLQEIISSKESMAFDVVHFPQRFHPQAEIAARSAECAYRLGGSDTFMSYVNFLFESDLTGNKVYDYISQAEIYGMDNEEFSGCLVSMDERLRGDIDLALNIGVNTTPSVFIGVSDDQGNIEGKLVSGLHTYEDYIRLIDEYAK